MCVLGDVNECSVLICFNLSLSNSAVSICLLSSRLPVRRCVCRSRRLSICLSVCALLCKHGACIIRLERGSHCGRDNALASHGCCTVTSRDPSALHKACVNEQWGMFQPSKHSSLSTAPSRSLAGPNWVMLGLRNWGSGERGRRDEGEHRRGLKRNRSSSYPSLFWKRRFLWEGKLLWVQLQKCTTKYKYLCSLSHLILSENFLSLSKPWLLSQTYVHKYKKNITFSTDFRWEFAPQESKKTSWLLSVSSFDVTSRAPVASCISCCHVT